MRTFTKVFGHIVFALTILVLLFGMAFTVPKLFGYMPYVVVSSSMEPVIETGSVLFVDTNDTDVAVGDIVTYRLTGAKGEEVLVSHRIAGEQDGYYLTKGDNNDDVDLSPVSQEQLVGTYKIHIPKVGYLIAKLSEKVLIVSAAWIILLNVLSIVLNSLFPDEEDENEKEKNDEQDADVEKQKTNTP